MPLDNDTANVLKNSHIARSEFYAFLCRMFCNVPDDGFYKMLSEMSAKLKNLIGGTDNGNIAEGAKGLTEFIKKRESLSGNELSDFDLDTARRYTSMFCLTKSIPMDESIYTSDDHHEKGESYFRVKALFRKHGIEKTNKISENEDFVSYEFIFMSKLAGDCAEHIEAGKMDMYEACLKEQYDFHINHFDKWIYKFLDNIMNFNINDRLYKNTAQLALGFIQEDKLTLQELVN